MKLSTFKYHLGQGFRGMFKNGFMSLAAVATVAACSFILILSLCIGMNIDYILQQFEETIGITVFLGPDVDEEMAMEIQDKIIAIDHVSEVVYKTSEENLDDALSTWENASILEGLREDNPLPASFEISLDGAAYQEEVVKQLETLQVSVEAELNSSIETDGVERIYLDENGNQITRKQAEQLGIVEPEEGEVSEAETAETAETEATTAAAAQEPATEVITSGAQADAEVTPSAEGSGASETPTAAETTAPAADTPTQTEAEIAPQEEAVTEEETEAVTYSSDPSAALLETLNSAVAATAGGRVELDGSYYYNNGANADEDYGVAGVELYDASMYGGVQYEYKGIEKIRHATEEANILVRINTAVRIFSLIVVIILCVISISIIMNTIRLTVVIRKNEINIMKYVGATDWFIRWPFIIEGMLIGFIGSVIPTVLCFLGYTECLHLVAEKIPVLNNIAEFAGAVDIFIYAAPVTIVFGVLLGVIGSVSSMRKYLRV